jgi:hypothetical protein
VQEGISLTFQIAGIIYLVLGIAYTFFGILYVHFLISLFTGLIVGAFPYFLLSGSTFGLCASIILFAATSFGCCRLYRLHAALLGAYVGTAAGSVAWALLAVFGIPLYFKYIFEIFGVVYFCWFFYTHDDEFLMPATAFLGSNMIAISITLATNDRLGFWGNLGVKIACIIVLSFAGLLFQHKFGFKEMHDDKEREIRYYG